MEGGAGRRTDRWREGQEGGQTDGGRGRKADRQMEGGAGRRTDRWREGQAGRRTEVERGRQTEAEQQAHPVLQPKSTPDPLSTYKPGLTIQVNGLGRGGGVSVGSKTR